MTSAPAPSWRLFEAFGEAPHCTLIGHTQRTSAPSAVLANGTLIRVLDLNDYVVGADPVSGARGWVFPETAETWCKDFAPRYFAPLLAWAQFKK